MSNATLFPVLDRQATLAKLNYETLENKRGREYWRGLLPREEYAQLTQDCDSACEQWSYFQLLSVGALLNVQRAHRAYCKARASVARVPVLIARSLREVIAQLIALESHAPPGLKTAPNVLATCHASNAPGLFPIAMNYWQVPRE